MGLQEDKVWVLFKRFGEDKYHFDKEFPNIEAAQVYVQQVLANSLRIEKAAIVDMYEEYERENGYAL